MLLSSIVNHLFTALLPGSFLSRTGAHPSTSIPSSKLLSSSVTRHIEALRIKYSVSGITLSISSNVTNITETLGFGIANAKGDPVTEKVG